MTAKKRPSKSTRKKTTASAARNATAKTATRAPAKKVAPTKPKASATAEPELQSVLGTEDRKPTLADPKLPKETMQSLYRTMVQVREFDRRMLALQRQGRIGFYGPILGQEAATVGSAAACEPQDWIFPALREAAAAIMRGLPLVEAIAQLVGNDKDRCKGRQMPCHYTYKEGNYYGMSSVIGTQITHAVGAAMAAKIRGDDAVMLGYMGDGATSANDFHAGMNFAQVYKAPVVMVCQNNQWAISVPLSAQTASATIAQKGAAYGMRSVRVDGNDVLAVYAATKEAVEYARSGNGPTFVEAVTYRRLGHSSSDDPSRYRDDAEVEPWVKLDPVDRFRQYLQGKKLWDSKREEALKQEIADEVNAAIRDAEDAGPPPVESLITDVFEHPTKTMVRDLRSVFDLAQEAGEVTGEFPL